MNVWAPMVIRLPASQPLSFARSASTAAEPKAINTKKLPATRVGDTWVLRDAAVQAHARRSA
ncbi:hypothetical protein SCD75_00045 (plasmid) [Prescottella equi]|nr:hypothetical protein SCD75_00045 [Prescottella equi]